MRNLSDVRAWLSQPHTGASETIAAPYWRLLAKMAPNARVVIVRRPVEEVVESIMRIEKFGAGSFNREILTKAMRFCDGKLTQAARRLKNVLVVNFAELEREDVCASIFEHCLPYKHDPAWWRFLAPMNIQCEFHAQMRYVSAFAQQLLKFGELAAYQMRVDLAARSIRPPDGMTFQEETFAAWRAATLDKDKTGNCLADSHCVAVGEAPSFQWTKNWDMIEKCAAAGNVQIVTARSNGRIFGHLVTLLAPSMETAGRTQAIHTFFHASQDAPGVGLKLQRFALARLKGRGVDEVFFRAAMRENEPKLGALFQRLGAKPDGELFRLSFEGI